MLFYPNYTVFGPLIILVLIKFYIAYNIVVFPKCYDKYANDFLKYSIISSGVVTVPKTISELIISSNYSNIALSIGLLLLN